MNWHLPADLGSHASGKVHFSCWIPKEVMFWSCWVLAFAGHTSSYLEVWNIKKAILILSFVFLAALVADSTINALQSWFVKKFPSLSIAWPFAVVKGVLFLPIYGPLCATVL